MLLRPKNLHQMRREIENLKPAPKVIVVVGVHEPSESTFRLVASRPFGASSSPDNKPLHEKFEPHEVVFVKFPKDYTPQGELLKSYAFFKTAAKALANGKRVWGVREPQLGEKLLEILGRLEKGTRATWCAMLARNAIKQATVKFPKERRLTGRKHLQDLGIFEMSDFTLPHGSVLLDLHHSQDRTPYFIVDPKDSERIKQIAESSGTKVLVEKDKKYTHPVLELTHHDVFTHSLKNLRQKMRFMSFFVPPEEGKKITKTGYVKLSKDRYPKERRKSTELVEKLLRQMLEKHKAES